MRNAIPNAGTGSRINGYNAQCAAATTMEGGREVDTVATLATGLTGFMTDATGGMQASGSSLTDMLITAADPTVAAVAIPAFLEFGAVVAGAVSGALVATDKHLDIIGVCVLAFITALGGGLVRDMILPTDQIYMLDNPLAVILTTLVGLAAFFFASLFYKLDKPIAVFDIISVALFTISGTDKALMLDYGLIPCVFMGVITGVGGGLFRDVCLGRIPNIFRSSNFYAVCSLAGAIVYFVLVECHVVKLAAAAACAIVVVGLRWLSLRYNLMTAVPVDLTPKLMGPLRRLRHRRTASRAGGSQAPNNSAEDDARTNDEETPGQDKFERWDEVSERRP